jgi:dsRNA-specific ribonuclease
VDGSSLGAGTGSSKKASEQAAAREALQRLDAVDEPNDAPHLT